MKNLRVHYFQHIAGEGFGSCYTDLKEMGAKITATEFFALPKDLNFDIEALPDVADVDLLIVMGGAMSVNDEANYPWLKIEKRWIRRYLAMQKPAIGLCLGGQLIANALGAPVTQNREQEMGWSEVYSSQQLNGEYFRIPNQLRVMQWHGETFEIPKGAVRLAENLACANQLYQIGKNVLGFQFHPEMTQKVLDLFIENEEQHQVFHGPYVQSLQELKNSQAHEFIQGNQILKQAIAYVLGQ